MLIGELLGARKRLLRAKLTQWWVLSVQLRSVWNIYRDYPGILIVLIYFRKWDGIVG